MTAENRNLIIFEGLSCSGKSSLIDRIASTLDCACIARSIPRDLPNPTPEYFMQNDELKYAMVESCQGLVLMDRGFLSTLVFYTVMEEVKPGFVGNKVKKWVKDSLGKTIQRPDYYVYVDIPSEVSRERARNLGRPFDYRNLWMTHTEQMKKQYETYLGTLEINVPLFRLDGTLPINYLQEELGQFIIESLSPGKK
jgi:thymidylate kinase